MRPNSHTEPTHKLYTPALINALSNKAVSKKGYEEVPYRATSFTKILLTTGLSLATLHSAPAAFADTLTVTVNNIEKAGEIHVAVYDNAEAFEADRGEKGGAAPGITEGTIDMVEPGSVTYVYELSLIHI